MVSFKKKTLLMKIKSNSVQSPFILPQLLSRNGAVSGMSQLLTCGNNYGAEWLQQNVHFLMPRRIKKMQWKSFPQKTHSPVWNMEEPVGSFIDYIEIKGTGFVRGSPLVKQLLGWWVVNQNNLLGEPYLDRRADPSSILSSLPSLVLGLRAMGDSWDRGYRAPIIVF